jgi:hypothetical protein
MNTDILSPIKTHFNKKEIGSNPCDSAIPERKKQPA